MTELRRIADQIDRWARFNDVPPVGLDEAARLRRTAESLEAIVADAEVTNHNSDGDEISGCRWCDTPWGHEDGCPIQRIEQVLGG